MPAGSQESPRYLQRYLARQKKGDTPEIKGRSRDHRRAEPQGEDVKEGPKYLQGFLSSQSQEESSE